MKELKEAFEELRKIHFPEFSEDDRLADWIADLVEMDSFIAGIAMSTLHGQKIKYPNLKQKIVELRNQLEDIKEIPDEDKSVKNACYNYLSALEKVIKYI